MVRLSGQSSLASAPVDSLVDDTLRIIFEHSCWTNHCAPGVNENYWTKGVHFFELKEVFTICLVSQRWNTIARNHAVLWTHTHLHHSELVQLQLKLSKKALLQIICGNGYSMCEHSLPMRQSMFKARTVDDIEKNMYRVELVSFALKPGQPVACVQYLLHIFFSTAAPQLKSWHMCFLGQNLPPPHPFRNLELPRLCHIHWEYLLPPHGDWCPTRFLNGLTHLIVQDYCSNLSDRNKFDLLSILRSNPALEQLVLVGVFQDMLPTRNEVPESAPPQ
ncbi:MAG TPA: hypothetical protein VGO47_11470 [Chlamydiales bacterium]|nr:hypothetical protein [Chlamydiales bacterium]